MQNVIAIDGPSGSGKSTVARLVSKELDFLYIDTGAMFRAIAYFLDKTEILETNDAHIQQFLNDCDFKYTGTVSELIHINGENLTSVIREHHVSGLASVYSKNPIIREFLKKEQQKLGNTHFCVMEGRDIGSVVFPKAKLKIFLTASNEVRAQRRFEELQSKGEGIEISKEQILKDIIERDERDSNRKVAPLIQAGDAVKVLSDDLTIQEVVQKIISLAKERF